jgi:hypothetical protein
MLLLSYHSSELDENQRLASANIDNQGIIILFPVGLIGLFPNLAHQSLFSHVSAVFRGRSLRPRIVVSTSVRHV